jgi:L-Ala-D/L-Glu epimerase
LANPSRVLSAREESWPIAGTFTISRGSKRQAEVVVAAISDGPHIGRGECVPYARYGESIESVMAAIEGCSARIAAGMSRQELQAVLPAGAARNAIDCALWDLEAKQSGVPAASAAGVRGLRPVLTAYTLSLGAPDAMADAARAARSYPLLKLKLGGDGDGERMMAVRAARPDARLIADANEAWPADRLEEMLREAARAGIELIEQPLPAGADAMLAEVTRLIPVCADESAHDSASLRALVGRYDAVNIKLDKTGGLTEALATAAEARSLGLKIMVGCMVATSLAMAPALVLAQDAEWVDLDGPLLLSRDREHGLTYEGSNVSPSQPKLWG